MGEKEKLRFCTTCRCHQGMHVHGTEFSNSIRTAPYQQIDRMEELIGDLIGFIAKTNAKTALGENQLFELEIIIARLESQYKILQKNNESLLSRIASLEKRLDSETLRRQAFLLEGVQRVPQ
ncbi:hypothetical protein [Peribacillus glennii]|uniref:Uncharacterized protein n=1 Tax=Peribacillus glennii TaxID=2303991 RepID=A0A372L8K2_9BACI|nr:hypothetical protein [Peribacillus glennii]RFU60745.1 hypothetical protein D0466_20545 [Peribacillus glennii]